MRALHQAVAVARSPLAAYGVGALLVVAGVAAVYWPAGLICAGLIVAVTVIDFGATAAGGDDE